MHLGKAGFSEVHISDRPGKDYQYLSIVPPAYRPAHARPTPRGLMLLTSPISRD